MREKEAARRSCHYDRAKASRYEDPQILTDYGRACLVGGLLIAVSFGCMFLWAAVMW